MLTAIANATMPNYDNIIDVIADDCVTRFNAPFTKLVWKAAARFIIKRYYDLWFEQQPKF